MIHSDIWGPSRINNVSGARWLLTFIDADTWITWLFLLKEKSEVGENFQYFKNMIQTQFQEKLQVLRIDNGRFFHSNLGSYLSEHGIIHQSSCVDTPQQNGMAERKSKHLLEVARSLMLSSHVPKQFWGEAVLTATYLINRMPSGVLNFQTPCANDSLSSIPLSISYLEIPVKVFACTAFVHINQPSCSNLTQNPFSVYGYSPS